MASGLSLIHFTQDRYQRCLGKHPAGIAGPDFRCVAGEGSGISQLTRNGQDGGSKTGGGTTRARIEDLWAELDEDQAEAVQIYLRATLESRRRWR